MFREETSAVRPRKLPYKPVIGGLENRTEYGSYSSRGLNIRLRLPDRTGKRIHRAQSAIYSVRVSTPQNGA